MFLLVPAYPGCPGSKAVKWSSSLLLLLLAVRQSIIRSVQLCKVMQLKFWNFHGMLCFASALRKFRLKKMVPLALVNCSSD